MEHYVALDVGLEETSVCVVDKDGQSVREINQAIRQKAAAKDGDITVQNPGARHNFAVAILADVHIRIAGSVGYYCGGLGAFMKSRDVPMPTVVIAGEGDKIRTSPVLVP